MEALDSDLNVNRNIHPDAVTCDRMRLIGPKCDPLGPINHCLLEVSQWENKLVLSTQDWVLSLDVNRFQNTWGQLDASYHSNRLWIYILDNL